MCFQHIIVLMLFSLSCYMASRFESTFRQCLYQINGYVRLLDAVETLRQEKYSKDIDEHEKKLLQVR